ncbi:MAG: hypothetical protein UR28_C0017G0012 [Candidatus Peregrinibacteria bacterium GW2011_GWF2_33_10]|nr:MAG: hypothetical protein UR28_C0017G0012 [Candidatus Peregrinibacteria bacterium GW2011_GWF2_33_10]OGJ44566.1 MAG: hypothetical protein A2263_02540 [Candidatus Peregrinibacteria bacterium RIFOXYA2_FULL_33_21]OGJ44872.1 MAG: hypothetical protein A2272_01850 [Candidatus Peregrinibacteria bacterium RIFOXYA12_FULL_33_12]OGJ50047.1 MAG: hypothetical protein A2307_01440 [Candidatus Peregrinibacteria bacterium RIFOXYB2_FULL_33_20]
MIKKIIVNLAINIVALYAVVYFIDSIDYTGGWGVFVFAGIVISLLNSIVKPVLKLITMPAIFFSAGLFLILINGFIFYLTDYIINVLNFYNFQLIVTDRLDYLYAAIVFGFCNYAEKFVLKALK